MRGRGRYANYETFAHSFLVDRQTPLTKISMEEKLHLFDLVNFMQIKQNCLLRRKDLKVLLQKW